MLISLFILDYIFIQPDKGKAVGKLLKHLISTFIKQGIDKKKNFRAKGLSTHLRAGTLQNSYYLSAA